MREEMVVSTIMVLQKTLRKRWVSMIIHIPEQYESGAKQEYFTEWKGGKEGTLALWFLPFFFQPLASLSEPPIYIVQIHIIIIRRVQ